MTLKFATFHRGSIAFFGSIRYRKLLVFLNLNSCALRFTLLPRNATPSDCSRIRCSMA